MQDFLLGDVELIYKFIVDAIPFSAVHSLLGLIYSMFYSKSFSLLTFMDSA
jgi:hypothetical protein